MRTARALADWLSSIVAGATEAPRVPDDVSAWQEDASGPGTPRRIAIAPEPPVASERAIAPEPATAPELVLRLDRRTASLDGLTITLTRREYDLLLFLACHPRQVFSRGQLLERVWQYETACGERTVDVHVLRLRRKLHGRGPLITTVRGIGYRLDGSDRLGVENG
jgi:DNA-binding response OmpR family regulator